MTAATSENSDGISMSATEKIFVVHSYCSTSSNLKRSSKRTSFQNWKNTVVNQRNSPFSHDTLMVSFL